MFGLEKHQLNNEDEKLNGKKLRIGIVQARFNETITNALAQACKDELLARGVKPKNIEHITVAGALEVPVVLQALAEQDEFDALIALGCIIRGETYHFDLVANESAAGVSRVALDYKISIANAILTVENEAQAIARQTINGTEAARIAIEMSNLMAILA